MAPVIEPRQGFLNLVESIPGWLQRLDALTAQCDEQYERFYRLSKNGHVKLSRSKKHDSTETLRDKRDMDDVSPPDIDMENAPAGETSGTPTPVNGDTPPRQSTQTSPTSITTDIIRKRKPGSDFSGASGPGRYRTNSMVVVFYDSAIQDGFATLVKDIANVRSTMRKSRNTATVRARMVAPNTPHEGDPKTAEEVVDPQKAVAAIGRTRLGRRTADNSPDKQKYKVYDEADRDLDSAQTLSEKGAHQFLRDGDSRHQINGMRKYFGSLQILAKREVDQPQGDHGAGKVLNPPSGTAGSSSEVPRGLLTPENSQETEPPSKTVESLDDAPKMNLQAGQIKKTTHKSDDQNLPPSTTPINLAATGIIEVDDAASDASSMKIDIGALRRMTRRVGGGT